jgi:hypothetical protein
MAGEREEVQAAGAGPSPEPNAEEEPGGQGLRNTLLAVAIGVALFLASWFVLDLQPLSERERAEVLEYTVLVPALLELCAERAEGDASELRRASLRTADLFQKARDRSAVGLIAVPPGSTMAAELDRRSVDAAKHARDEFGPMRSPAQWREVCAALLADFRSEDTAWARLQEKYGNQLRKLDVTR